MKDKFWKWFGASFDTNTVGMSARKATAFVLMACVVAIHVGWIYHACITGDFDQMIPLLTVDFSFIGALLAMTTWGPSGNKSTDTSSETK